MKILLLNPPFKFKISRESRWPEFTKSGTLYYPFWLAHATGVLMKTKHKPLLLDAVAKKWNTSETIKEIIKFKPDMIVIETTTPSITSDIKFIEEIKNNIDVKIVLVGTHVSALPEETLKMSNSIDFVARREYDYTIPDLADCLENKGDLKNVLGISYRKNKKIIHNKDRPLIKNLDSLPFVSKVYKKFLDIEDYRYALARHPMIQIWSSRGCPNMCTFCQFPQTLSGRMFRTRSPENFVDELEWIERNLPQVKEVFIEDDTFSTDKKRVLEICDLIKKRDLDIVWSCNVRADVPFLVLKNMKEAGCRMLIVGYESGNNEILRNIKKGINTKQAKKFTEDAKKIGLKIFGCFMIGLPGDTKKTIEQTFQFAKELNPDMVFFQQAVPFPGTEFYEWCKRKGYLTIEQWDEWLDKNGQLASVVSYPNLTNTEIKKLRDDLTIKFYKSPKWIFQTLVRNNNPNEIIRLLKAAKDYLLYLFQKD
jgi:radical SAM superfamily enzyme YgiQ (UPF0313 family)